MALTIIEVERQTGISSRKIRFWCDKGLFPFVQSDSNGVRYFSKSDIAWVQWVQCLRACNMPLATIKAYIHLSKQGLKSAPQRKALLEKQLTALHAQLETLHHAERKIAHKIALYTQMIEEQKDFLNPLSPTYQGNPKKTS
ncbi:MerR family transcriptional regulator [Helicobacter ailurogastricus]|uniref:MerR family transcriptional regulator n=1 Tax=Helicobacter ailurogastricus TaxID=1578720 RepID=UPI0022BA75C4|nr:MerR family transcriptional regulator [Helicobacter ailurogastricus]GLH58391.1 transcriptional regulator [Helicobacter ailurogastricus]GLH59495.1 transcriptional regulator [Helicobacter ailurogastricus]